MTETNRAAVRGAALLAPILGGMTLGGQLFGWRGLVWGGVAGLLTSLAWVRELQKRRA